LTLSFPPVQAGAGQRFRVIVEAPEAGPLSAVTLWYDPAAPYDAGTRLQNGTEASGDLVMRIRYQGDDTNTASAR
jgi:hypothetical protein